MTIAKFAKEIGAGIGYVRNRVESGEIPTEHKEINGKTYYQIDPALIPEWKEKAKTRKKGKSPASRIVAGGKRDKDKVTGNDAIREATRQLENLKKEKGLDLSYGEAVARGYIKESYK